MFLTYHVGCSYCVGVNYFGGNEIRCVTSRQPPMITLAAVIFTARYPYMYQIREVKSRSYLDPAWQFSTVNLLYTLAHNFPRAIFSPCSSRQFHGAQNGLHEACLRLRPIIPTQRWQHLWRSLYQLMPSDCEKARASWTTSANHSLHLKNGIWSTFYSAEDTLCESNPEPS